MAFVQIVEFRTSKPEEIWAIEDEWARATEGRRTLRRLIMVRDRGDAERYVLLAFFDSYESAMENSSLPETSASAQRFAELVDGPLTFRDLDVVRDLT